jgi:hypothetical protein
LSVCAHGNARFRLQTPDQRPGGPKAISYQFRVMVTQDDRNHLAWLKQRLALAKKNGDANEYHRSYNDMLRFGNRLVADQRWWEIWPKEEAFKIMADIFAIPPYLGLPSPDQIDSDLAVHREIGKNLREQTASLERTELVVQIIDYAATAAGVALGVGSFAVGAKEVIKRVGVRKAGELLAEGIIKSQIKQELQDQTVSALAEAAGVDPELVQLVQAVKDAKDARRGAPRKPAVAAMPKPRAEFDSLNKRAVTLQQDQRWIQHGIVTTPTTPRPKFRKSTKQALGPLKAGEERRHFVPWEMIRNSTDAAVTDENWKRVAQKIGYDPAKFKDMDGFKKQWQRDLFNETNNVWKGAAAGNPRGRPTGDARIDYAIWPEKRESILNDVLTDENWKRWAQRDGYNPADFTDMRDFKTQWFQDWRTDFEQFFHGGGTR